MTRPHIEFIQAQNIPWKVLPASAARPGVECKVLSRDNKTGAVTTILRYPKGFAISKDHHLNQIEEFFVLDGSIQIGNITYNRNSYAYLPTGFQREGMGSNNGAAVLTFFEGNHQNIYGEYEKYDKSELKLHIDISNIEYSSDVDPKVVGMNLGKILLREDEQSGERTWILRMGPSDREKNKSMPLETHPHVEEMFILQGEISMPAGTLHKGAYFWRPGGIQHGPVGSRSGCLLFFRCKEGPFTTSWSEEEHLIVWDAPYNPILPEEFKPYLETETVLRTDY